VADAGDPSLLDHVDRCIESYVRGCRRRIPEFVEQHFALRQTWQTQQRTLWSDLLIAPVNSVWAVPYLALKRLCEGLETLGVTAAGRWLSTVPPGVKTGYEQSVERAIAREVLEWDVGDETASLPPSFGASLVRHPALQGSLPPRDPELAGCIRRELEKYSTGRALVSSAAGSGLTVLMGWLAFGSFSMGLTDMADRIARSHARSRAASRFFLGRQAGSVFYGVFRPSASFSETLVVLTILMAALAIGGTLCTIVSDPLRKTIGLHQRRLEILIDALERDLTMWARRWSKKYELSSHAARWTP